MIKCIKMQALLFILCCKKCAALCRMQKDIHTHESLIPSTKGAYNLKNLDSNIFSVNTYPLPLTELHALFFWFG